MCAGGNSTHPVRRGATHASSAGAGSANRVLRRILVMVVSQALESGDARLLYTGEGRRRCCGKQWEPLHRGVCGELVWQVRGREGGWRDCGGKGGRVAEGLGVMACLHGRPGRAAVRIVRKEEGLVALLPAAREGLQRPERLRIWCVGWKAQEKVEQGCAVLWGLS